MNEEILQSIIKHYFLTPDETITKIELQESEALISAGLKQWLVTLASSENTLEHRHLYELYEIETEVVAEPPPRPAGVAVLPNNKMFWLNNQKEFQAFWQQIRGMTEPLELAKLLTRYQGEGPYLEKHQNLIVLRDDLTNFLENSQIDAISDFTLFKVFKSQDGVIKLDFCTFYIAPEPPDDVFRISLNLWKVEEVQGHLDWSIKPIARRLDSPFYSPK